MNPKEKNRRLKRRKVRIRALIKGTGQVPRLCVSRSSQHISAQIINDEKGLTLLSASDFELGKGKISPSKTLKVTSRDREIAYKVGMLLGEKAGKKNIKKVVFDRSGRAFHGRVKALALGAREKGLKF